MIKRKTAQELAETFRPRINRAKADQPHDDATQLEMIIRDGRTQRFIGAVYYSGKSWAYETYDGTEHRTHGYDTPAQATEAFWEWISK